MRTGLAQCDAVVNQICANKSPRLADAPSFLALESYGGPKMPHMRGFAAGDESGKLAVPMSGRDW